MFATYHSTESILTRHQHCFLVPLLGCTLTVVQLFKLCSKLLLRFAEGVGGGVGWMLSRDQKLPSRQVKLQTACHCHHYALCLDFN